MKKVFGIAIIAVAAAAMCSCQPSAQEMAQEYQALTKELAEAKIAGDDAEVERIKEEMEDLNRKIEKAAAREAKKVKKDIEKGAKKLGKDIENAFEDLVK